MCLSGRNLSPEAAGKATAPDSVISRCQIEKYGTGLLLSLKRIPDVLGQDVGGDWSKGVYISRSWTNVARPCFLLKEDPASQ